MIFKFTLLSDEADDFVRVISIDAEASFLDLNNSILQSVNYNNSQMTTFFMCSDDWEKGQEVTLVEMESSSEYDNLLMEDTKLEELLSDEKQKLLFVFDMLYERAFFMELTEIIPGAHMDKTDCIQSEGVVPPQTIGEDELVAASKFNVDESFYGDEDFDLDELDEEGFGDMNFDDSSLFNDDGKF